METQSSGVWPSHFPNTGLCGGEKTAGTGSPSVPESDKTTQTAKQGQTLVRTNPEIFFISDLHLGHKGILNFSPNRAGTTIDQHDAILEERYRSVVKPRDVVWFLGDVAFTVEKLRSIKFWPGRKNLIRGNHDKFPFSEYTKIFSDIHGIVKRKGYWLSHCPIHPDELRGCKNIHGHIHNNVLDDPRYISVCVESTGGFPIRLSEIADGRYSTAQKNGAQRIASAEPHPLHPQQPRTV